MWTATQMKAFQSALSVAEKHKEGLALLLQIAQYAPTFKERIETLEHERELLYQIAATALAISTETRS